VARAARCSQLTAPGQERRSHRGRYHTGRRPRAAEQQTARCPAALPALATAEAQSHIDQLTVMRPGPH